MERNGLGPAGAGSVKEQRCLTMAAPLVVFFVGFQDAGFLEAQDLVVISMAQLVEHHPGLLVDVPRRGQIGRHDRHL